MQLLTISLLVASTLAQGEDPCPPNPNSPSCDDPPQETICQLTCKRDSDCKQNEGDSNKCDKMGVDVSSEAHADMFATRCKQICEESRDAEGAENVCRFYKVSDFGSEVVCSLMDDTQCQATGPCRDPHCVSDDVGCKDTPIPTLGCPASFNYTDSAFHFGCDHCNPYSDETCKAGNKCFTTERCSEWDSGSVDQSSDYWRKLAVECTRFGTWVRLTGADGSDEDYVDVLGNDDTAPPQEPNCTPLPVEILKGVPDEEGADFLCDKELELAKDGIHLQIVAPNTCVLLCDFHLSMNLECRINDHGETKCFDEGEETPTEPDNIYCWVPPTPPTGGPTPPTTTPPTEKP